MAGAWHVPAGVAFLVRTPSLWPLAALPGLLALVLGLLGVLCGHSAFPYVEQWLVPGAGRVGETLGQLTDLLLWVAMVLAGALLGLAVAMVLMAPVLEALSRRVEKRMRGTVVGGDGGVAWEIAESLRAALFFLAASPFVILLSFIPVAGPIFGTLWAAYALSFQLTDVPLARRGLDFKARRAWNRRWRAETMGFGLVGLLMMLIPLAVVVMLPALTVGATLLVLEFEEGREMTESPLKKQG
jgi:CysZ protein